MGTDKNQAGWCLGKPSCASEPDSLASKLADSPVSESLLAPRVALVFSRSARDQGIAKNWYSEKAWGTPGLPGWRGF